jgi:hypothetical protein
MPSIAFFGIFYHRLQLNLCHANSYQNAQLFRHGEGAVRVLVPLVLFGLVYYLKYLCISIARTQPVIHLESEAGVTRYQQPICSGQRDNVNSL